MTAQRESRRPVLLGGIAALVLVVAGAAPAVPAPLVAAGAASAASAPAASVPVPTHIHLELPARPERARVFRVSARLEDQAGRPIGGARLTFYQATTFGPLPIKTLTTDERGRASLLLREAYLDSLVLGARFAGDARHGAAQVEGEVVFRGAAAPPAHPPRHSPSPSPAVKSVVFLVVGGVWLTYTYAILLVVQMTRAP